MKKFIAHIIFLAGAIGVMPILVLLGNGTQMPIWNSNFAMTVLILSFSIGIPITIFTTLAETTPNCAFLIRVVAFVAVFLCVLIQNKLKGAIWWNGGTTMLKYTEHWLWVVVPTYIAAIVVSIPAVQEKLN